MVDGEKQISKDSGRLLVMGDVHGHYEKMVRVIEYCGYRPGIDQLVLLGDYVDRGPDSRRVASEVLNLAKTGAVALYGNHEDMMCRALKNRNIGRLGSDDLEQWLSNGGETTLRSYRAHSSELDAHLKFFSQRPSWFENKGFVFVHAGIRPGRAMNEQSLHDMIWIRDEYIMGYKGPWNIVTGHTPTQYLGKIGLYQDVIDFSKPVVRNHKFFIDTGVAWRGLLTVMELMSGEIWQA